APAPPPPDAPRAVVSDRLRACAGRETRALAAALAGGRLVERTPELLRIAAPSRFASQRLADRREALEAACARFFGRALRVQIETREDGPPAIARPEDREAQRKLRERALEHGAVNTALEGFEARGLDIRPAHGSGPRGSCARAREDPRADRAPRRRAAAAARHRREVGDAARLPPARRTRGAGPRARRGDRAPAQRDRALRGVLRPDRHLALRDLPRPEARPGAALRGRGAR